MGVFGGEGPRERPPMGPAQIALAGTALLPLASHRALEYVTLQLQLSSWQGFLHHVLPPLGMIGLTVILWQISPPLPGHGGTHHPGHRGLAIAAGLLLGTLAAFANLLTMLAGNHTGTGVLASVNMGAVGLVVHVALLAPVAEELAFRGLIYRHLRRALFPLASGVLSSLIFAVMHASLGQGVWALVLGLIAAVAYEQTRSILSPILIHGLFNAVPIGVAVVRSRPGDIGPLWLVLCAVAMIFTVAARSAGEAAGKN